MNDFDYVCANCIDNWYSIKKADEANKSYVMIEDVHTCINRNPLIIKLRREMTTNKIAATIEFEVSNKNALGDDEENDSISDLEDQSTLDAYLASEAKYQSNHGRMCKFLFSMSSSNRIRQIIAWGNEKKIPSRNRTEAYHNYYCEKCGNGRGYSIFHECLFCANVFHPECVGFSHNGEETEFVCDDCIIDFPKALALCECD